MIILLSLLIHTSYALYFTIPGHVNMCFDELTNIGEDVWGSYVISGRADHNVKAQVFNSDNEVIYKSAYRSREGSFQFFSDKGGYFKLCFKSMDGVPKTVSFELSSTNILKKFPKEDEFEPLAENLSTMERRLENVNSNIKFYQRREAVHRDLTEKTCERVIWGAIIKVAILITVSVLQIYMVRGFLDTKRISV